MTAARFMVSANDNALLESGILSPLRRWPRCTEIVVRPTRALGDASALALPFAGMPLESRQRITSLILATSRTEVLLQGSPGAALASLLYSLPALRCVKLWGQLSECALDHYLLYQSMSSLPYLSDLHMESGRALDRIILLADSAVRRLTVACTCLSTWLDTAMCTGISRLHQLQHLTVGLAVMPRRDWNTVNSGVYQLMRLLPPALLSLELQACTLPVGATVALTYDGGRVTSLRLEFLDYLPPSVTDVARFVALLPDGALAGPPLTFCGLGRMCIDLEASDPEALHGPELGRLRALLHRSARVEVGPVQVCCSVPPCQAARDLEVLGIRNIEELQLELWGTHDLAVRLRPAPPAAAAVPAAAHQPAPVAQPAEAAERGPELVALALQLLMAAGVQEDEHAAGRGNAAASSGGGDGGAATGGGHAQLPLLLLQGSGLPREPEALSSWLEQLEQQAAATAKLAGGGDEVAEPVARYLLLSDAATLPTVLMQCNDAASLAALEMAARAVAAYAAAAGLATAGPVAPALRVSSAFVGCEGSPLGQVTDACDAFACALSQAAQAIWDREGLGRGWSEQRRLRWILDEWARVRELPEA